MDRLDLYRSKRNFQRTREPTGKSRRRRNADASGGAYVVQKHAARRLHYDFRLEHDGVLLSWAVTRGPSLDPQEKRLAVHVEDHPLDYGGFEGTIPAGEYGGGTVAVWDEGRWTPEGDVAHALEKGHLSFTLEGHKLRGGWHLVRLKPRRGEKRDNWLLIKSDDEAARTGENVLETAPESVRSGRTIEEIAAADDAPVWSSKRGGLVKEAKGTKPTEKADGGKVGRAARRRRRHDGLPRFVDPCLATLQDKPPAGESWLHEVKFDGYRIQARISGGKVTLLTRTGLDWTERFGTDLGEALAALPCDNALIDGEVVVMGEDGLASFAALQAALSGERDAQLVYYAFDLLHLDGRDLRSDPLLARKEVLHDLIGEASDTAVRFSEHFVEPGERMLSHACRMGLEGVVSKRFDAPYRSGRGHDWIKSKCTQRQEFVVTGYAPSKASPRKLGSILVGHHENGELKPAGRVGTGFTQKSASTLKKRLDGLATETSPYEGAAGRAGGVVWTKPDLVAEIEFRAWTASRQLRHASFVGLRDDKPAPEVVSETPSKPRRASPQAHLGRNPRKKANTAVKLSSPDKVLWPDCGLTKQGLLDYYASVWRLMEPFIVERPLSLVRAPDGIEGQSFFQKHAGRGLSSSVLRHEDSKGEELLFIRDFDGLAALVQLGTVEFHIWGTKVGKLETPDQIVFDLDPDSGIDLAALREATLTLRERLKELGFESVLKASGGKGYHVVVPLKPKAAWNEVKGFARDFAKALAEAEPKRFTATLSKKARRGRIFIDYLRNSRGSTAIAPYSTRARSGASIAVPLTWSDLATTHPNQWRANDPPIELPKEWSNFPVGKRTLMLRG